MAELEAKGTGNDPFSKFGNLSPTLAKVAFAWGVGQTAWGVAKQLREKAQERMRYTIKVPGTDEVFPDLHEWMLSLLPETQRRALIASTGEGASFGGFVTLKSSSPILEAGDTPEASERKRVRLRYDSTRSQTVDLDGHQITVELERDDTKNWDKIPDNWQALSQRMVFTARSPEGRNAIVNHIDALLEAKQEKPGPPAMRMANRWGSGWDRRSDLPPRTIESIILKDGQLERLIADLQEFLTSEADYNRRCLPWHRGYLFHGAPGTGKTSVAKALANHFDLPVYYLPMGDLKEDSELMHLVGNVNPRSMLVLEDVDVFHAMTQRNDNDGRVTLSAVLNALDGIWTPHGLITILTTNDRSVLDSALLRPGRVDIEEEFSNLDCNQMDRLMLWFYEGKYAPAPETKSRLTTAEIEKRSPALLIGAMSKAKDDPTEALRLFLADA